MSSKTNKGRGRYAKTLVLFNEPADGEEIRAALEDLRGRRDVDASVTVARRYPTSVEDDAGADAWEGTIVDAVLATRATAGALVVDRLERFARCVVVASTVDPVTQLRIVRVRQASRDEAFAALRARIEPQGRAGGSSSSRPPRKKGRRGR